jgi:hypothetical protein
MAALISSAIAKTEESLTVPLDHRCRLDQNHRLQAARPQPVEPDPNYAINREKLGAPGPLAAQDGELMAERYDLELQFYAAAKPTGEP